MRRALIIGVLFLASCSTPEPVVDPYFARGYALGRANDEAGIAIEWARLKNPIGDHAAMSVDERAAALKSLFDGWKQGKESK